MGPENQPEGISAVVILYNEEKIVERCLKSLVGVVDEIVVIHDGECTDNTLAISRNYTDGTKYITWDVPYKQAQYIRSFLAPNWVCLSFVVFLIRLKPGSIQ